MEIHVAIVTGEPSGENLAYGLVKKLLSYQNLNIKITGIFGDKIKSLGFEPLFSQSELAVMGFVEPLLRLPRLLEIRKKIIDFYLNEQKPNIFIGIDSPDFNLNIAKNLRAHGIKTAQYVSPTIWAWRAGRINLIKKAVDTVFCLFPFEPALYKKVGVDAVFVGHPLANSINTANQSTSKSIIKAELDLQQDTKNLVVMPGSRDSELKHMLSTWMQAAEKLQGFDNIIIPYAKHKHKIYLQNALKNLACNKNVILTNSSYKALAVADFALVTSGTATLEVLLHKVPMVIGYKTSIANFFISKILIKSKFIGLPNILANRKLVPELIQNQCKTENILLAVKQVMQEYDAQSADAIADSLNLATNKIVAKAILDRL